MARRDFSPIFRESVKAIPIVIRREFDIPDERKPLDTAFYTSNNAIVKVIKNTGDPKNVLPFVGIKVTSVFPNPETYNSRLLKRVGLPLYYRGTNKDDLELMTLFCRPVLVEAEAVFLTDSYEDTLDFMEQLMFIGSELHFSIRVGNGSVPIKFKISKDGLAIPEGDFQSEIANYSLTFPISLHTYSGIVTGVPVINKVKLNGGIGIENIPELEVDRKFNLGRVLKGDSVNNLIAVDVPVGLDTDLIESK